MPKKQIVQEIEAAIERDDAEEVAALIGSDKSLLETMTVFGTWLHVAISDGSLDVVKRLVSMGADINRRGGILGAAPLKEAASDGQLEIVEYLLDCGAEMDVSEPERNPLFGAIYGGHVAVAKLLIDRGIDTQVKYNGEYMTDMDALAFANEWGRTEIAEMLKARKAL